MAPTTMKIIMISMITELMEMLDTHALMLSVKTLGSAAAISSLKSIRFVTPSQS